MTTTARTAMLLTYPSKQVEYDGAEPWPIKFNTFNAHQKKWNPAEAVGKFMKPTRGEGWEGEGEGDD